MTSSGELLVKAAMAALPLVNGKTSWPSCRSKSATICTMVNSSSTKRTLAMPHHYAKDLTMGKRNVRKHAWSGGKLRVEARPWLLNLHSHSHEPLRRREQPKVTPIGSPIVLISAELIQLIAEFVKNDDGSHSQLGVNLCERQQRRRIKVAVD